MLGFFGRWMSDAVQQSLALVFAIAAIQLPALTSDYAAALLQVSNDLRRDVDQREQAARNYYHLAAPDEDSLITAISGQEPSNAQTLRQSLLRCGVLRSAYDRIDAASPLLRPPVALLDALEDERGDKQAVLATAFATHVTQVAFTSAAATYGLVGLTLGSFAAHILVSLAMLATRRRGVRAA
jgi:Protein of unknown function (DUF2937)